MIYGEFPITKRSYHDTETTGLDTWLGDNAFAISMLGTDGKGCYVEWEVDPFTRRVLAPKEEVRELRRYYRCRDRRYVFHHAKFDVRVLEVGHGITVPHGRVDDTMFALHCWDTHRPRGGYRLKTAAKQLCQYPTTDEETLKAEVKWARHRARKLGWKIGERKNLSSSGKEKTRAMSNADFWLPRQLALLHPELFPTFEARERALGACRSYAMCDVERTYLLDEFTRMGLTDRGCWHTYLFEMRQLWPVVYRMETRGVRISRKACRREIDRCQKTINDLLPEIQVAVPWDDFNPDSPDQLRKFLYDVCKLPVKAWTPPSKKFPIRRRENGVLLESVDGTEWWEASDQSKPEAGGGQPSVSFGKGAAQEMLEQSKNPNIQKIVKVRSAGKAIASFFGNYMRLMRPDPLNPGGWALHPSFEQRGPRTTRFSCKDPNLQNVAGEGTTLGAEPIFARRPFGPRKRCLPSRLGAVLSPGNVLGGPGAVRRPKRALKRLQGPAGLAPRDELRMLWVLKDYDNMEARIFADFAQEENMLRTFREGRNVHTENCNRVWGGENNPMGVRDMAHALELDGSGKPYPQKSEFVRKAWERMGWKPSFWERRTGDLASQKKAASEYFALFDWDIVAAQKSLNKAFTRVKSKIMLFTKIFGGGLPAVHRLFRQQGVKSEDESRIIVAEFDRLFPRIPFYMRECEKRASKDGFVLTKHGDRISIDKDYAYRAINYETQGTAAMFIKRAMVRLDDWYTEAGLEAFLVMTIHDELATEAAKELVTPAFVAEECRLMGDVDRLICVDMKVEAKIATERWDEKTEWEKWKDFRENKRIVNRILRITGDVDQEEDLEEAA